MTHKTMDNVAFLKFLDNMTDAEFKELEIKVMKDLKKSGIEL